MASAQTRVTLSVDGRTATATLDDNAACRELVALLEKEPVSITMSDYGGFEKVGALPQSFTTSDTDISTVPGDIMLYQGNQMVIFYGTNSWDYTPLGKIDNATAESVRQFLGNGKITLTISLTSQSGIDEIATDQVATDKVYDLNGRIVTTRHLNQGVYIINGKKTMIK
ncbi:MAG: cyclophilin-like fold protein [Lachnoclostridium sp.]|nr:cyclophilin-like fold protein [Lachnoclostridium sp.]